MIAIDDVLVSDEVVEEQFVCDLTRCKGGCCEDGDAGAPLEPGELHEIDQYYWAFQDYMTPQGKEVVETSGRYIYDAEFGWVTPTIKGQMCAYGFKDQAGIVKCAIEQAYNEGKISWKKPISCHLFPIRISKSEDLTTDYLNYEPRPDLCAAACKLGKRLKVPVHHFLKEAIVRKYGEDFFETLDATVQYKKGNKQG